MKKFRFLIVFILLIALLATSFACGGGNSGDTDKPGGEDDNIVYTDVPIIENGVSDYKIVLSESNDDSYINFAANELVNFLYQSTGVTLEIITDKNLTYSDTAKYLSIGDTSLYRGTGFNYDLNTFAFSDFVVRTKGNSIFMLGANKYGTLYAVYELLEILVDYRAYTDVDVYVEEADSLFLPELNVYKSPSFDYRLASRSLTWNDSAYQRRMRMQGMDYVIMETGGKNHNSFGIMPKEKYFEKHRDWYSTDGEQLCYSQEDMLDEMIENLKVFILNDKSDAEIIIIGEQDVGTWCRCRECSASLEHYGSDSAVYIKALNYVASRLKTWQEENLPEHRPITYMLFAYYLPEKPPVTYNEAEGKWEPVDGIRCDDNVAVWYAPIYTSYSYPFTDVRNKSVSDFLQGWAAVTDNLYMWDYANNFNCYMINSNTFNVLKENMEFALECNVKFYFTQAAHDSRQPVFEELREFLTAQLMWDINQDYLTLINDFFSFYYKDAAPGVRKYFDGLRDWYQYLTEEKGVYGGIFQNLRKAEYWPKTKLEEWLGYLNEAYAAIEPIKETDITLYNSLYDRINKESLSVRFLLIDCYSSQYNSEELKQMRLDWKADAVRLKIANLSEGNPLSSSLFSEWGI